MFPMISEQKKSFYTVLLVVFVAFIGIAMPFPIFAPLLLVNNNFSSYFWLGIILAAFPFGQFIGSPILGKVSDQFGRRKVLALSLIGASIGYVISGIAVTTHSYIILIFARLVTGFLDSNFSTARAIVSDLEEINKHKGFGLIAAAATLGFTFGPLLGGLFSVVNYATPFYVAALLNLAAMVCCLIFLRETFIPTPTEQKNSSSWWNISDGIKKVASTPSLAHYFFIAVIINLATDIFYQFYPVFLVHTLHVSALQLSLYISSLAAGIGIGDGFLVGYFSNKITARKITFISIIGYALLVIMFIYVQQIWILYSSIFLIGIFAAFQTTFPAVEISNHTAPGQQGEIMGLLWGLRMLGVALCCLGGSLVSALFIKLPFLAIILLNLCGIYCLVRKGAS